MALLRFFLVLYQSLISPVIHFLAGPGYGCRFEPTCSRYSSQAFTQFGLWKGLWLTLRRISRCHPFGGSGYDPIPVVSPLPYEKTKIGPFSTFHRKEHGARDNLISFP